MSVSFIHGLPKAELHVHLEGTLEPEAMFSLGRRNDVALPWAAETELRAAYNFTGLEHFLGLYFQGCQVLRRRQDFYDLTAAYLSRAAAQGVIRAEMFFGPQSFLDSGVAIGEQLDGVLEAVRDARDACGIEGALLVSAHRHRTEADALELFNLVQPWADSIAGFGLGSAERGNPPSKFARYFAACRERGFATTIHAGEDGPASYVWEALDVCHVDRIDHGNAAVTDQALVHKLRDEKIPLTMCPVSNLKLGVVAGLREHPIGTLMTAGVLVTVNSDDPSYFGAYLSENYAAARDSLGLDDAELTTLARNSFAASFGSDEDISRQTALVDRYNDQYADDAGQRSVGR